MVSEIPQFSLPLAPLHPLAWASASEMLREVFYDMTIPWVQNYLLRSDAKFDVTGIINPDNYRRAMSFTYECKTIPELSNGFDATLFHARINIPVMSVAHIGVGVGISSSNVEDSADVIVSKCDQFYRFAINDKKQSQLNLWINEDLRRIEASFQSHENGMWRYAKLAFSDTVFLEAFSSDDGDFQIDFDKLEEAMLQSITGAIQFTEMTKLVTNEQYPHKAADIIGEHYHKGHFCNYANAKPMLALPVFSYGNWTFNYDAGALRKMQNWGITERLQRITVSVDRTSQVSDSGAYNQVYNLLHNGRRRRNNGNRAIHKHGAHVLPSVHDENVVDCTSISEEEIAPFPSHPFEKPLDMPTDRIVSPPLNYAEAPVQPHNSHQLILTPSRIAETQIITTQQYSAVGLKVPRTNITNYNAAPPGNSPRAQPQPLASKTATSKMNFVNIAPFPEPDKTQEKELTKEEICKAKAERRKIQKRIAAARYNDKKAAERLRNKNNSNKNTAR